MATTETVSSNYTGEAAQRFFSAALLGAETINNGGVEFVDGIRYKWNLPKLDLSSIVADSTCDFTPAGTVTRSERVLTVEEFEVNLQLCKSTYRPTFDRMQSSAHAGLAPTFADHLLGLSVANVAQHTETTIWSGVNATAGEFDGFETLFLSQAAQPAAFELAGTTVTAANVVAQLASILDAATSALYSAPGFAIRIPTNIYKHYIQAQAALGAYDAFNERKAGLNFLGVPLIHCPGMTDDIMFATYTNNLFYGCGSGNDEMNARVLDQENIDGSNNVHVVMKWAAGAQVANPEDVITYGITNAGN